MTYQNTLEAPASTYNMSHGDESRSYRKVFEHKVQHSPKGLLHRRLLAQR